MNKNENLLKKKFGKQQPFLVPEGYFDTFSARLMAKLPAQNIPMRPSTPSSLWASDRKKWVRNASLFVAGICAVLFSLNLIFSKGRQRSVQTAGNTIQVMTIDQAADYTMMDNDDIYAYVSDSY